MNFFNRNRVESYTLNELLVVLVIIGILVIMSLPVLLPLISKTRSVEAKQNLKHLHSLQKAYFYEFSKYSGELEQVGFQQDDLVTDSEEGTANYVIEIVNHSPSGFTGRATAVVDFDGDGTFNVWEINEKGTLNEVTKD
ncbi:type IV pilin protein [Mangrovivirga cuniculi]|uniref:General secretion pathway protein GspG n=1 Tax=Mangrovivirga cuniculi TaxID=2715131 RepID=A0A4D7JQG8_9BACT|nr:type II secretion system protein [Mangrovivirga cuniculi]QCK13766.1 general secretion pathway protein GspG [Mangrovivirga cuniculi]